MSISLTRPLSYCQSYSEKTNLHRYSVLLLFAVTQSAVLNSHIASVQKLQFKSSAAQTLQLLNLTVFYSQLKRENSYLCVCSTTIWSIVLQWKSRSENYSVTTWTVSQQFSTFRVLSALTQLTSVKVFSLQLDSMQSKVATVLRPHQFPQLQSSSLQSCSTVWCRACGLTVQEQCHSLTTVPGSQSI